MFVHFMPSTVCVCTALLPLGVIKDNSKHIRSPYIRYRRHRINKKKP